MKMHWIYFIFIKDGGGEDIGKENFFFGGGWREFPHIHRIFTVAQNLVLMTF